MNMKENS